MGTTLNSLPGLSSLYAAISGSSGTTASLLGAIYNTGTTGVSLGSQNPITALTNAETNQTQDIKATAAEPAVQRAISAFTKAVQTATSPQQLLSNPAVMQVLMTANGLADQIPYTALAQKTLLSNVNTPTSLVNQLTDTRWKPVVQTYDFANKGLSIIQNPSVISTITNAYAEITWRNSLNATTPGLSNALTFVANASSATQVDQILGDPTLRSVVTTTLGIPLQIAFQPLEAQQKAITSQLDITKLQDPKFVQQFAQRYLIAMAQSASASTTTQPSLAALAVQAQGLVV
ncbi:MAG TPA: DUF1217 domain-containing protein [Acetobacteraceae bacterium]|nr:DUF1217 domain-containing protein [Acetobacteraceae bacterium]